MSQNKVPDTEPEDEHVKFSCTVKYLSTFLDSVGSFREEGELIFTEDNIYTKVADPANVGMCISKIEGQALNSLDVQNAERLKVGLNFGNIIDAISSISNTSDIEVTWPVSSGGSRLIRLDVVDEDMQFELSTLNPDTVPNMPQADPLSHKSQVQVGGTELKKTINHAQNVIDSSNTGISFETFGETLQISSTDKTAGNFKKQFHNHDPSVDAELGEHQTFISVEYLDDIKKIFGKGDVVTVHVKDDNPVRFDIDLDDAGDAKVIYIIAPRLEAE